MPSAGLKVSLRSDAMGLCYASNGDTLDASESDASALRDTPRPAVMIVALGRHKNRKELTRG